MVSVYFSERFVFDESFYHFAKQQTDSKPTIMHKLMYINDKARPNKREHNIISKKIFDKILSENPRMNRAILRCSFKDFENFEIEKISDEIERNIKLAIDLLEEEPYRTIIFTSPEKHNEYLDNAHYQGVKEIAVRSGNEALTLINDYYISCTEN